MKRSRPFRLRLQITLWSTAILGVSLLGFTLLNYFFLNTLLYDELDQRLRVDAQLAIGQGAAADPETTAVALRWVELVGPDGTVLHSVHPQGYEARLPAFTGTPSQEGPLTVQLLVKGGYWVRMLQVPHPDLDSGVALVRVARSEAPLRHELRDYIITHAISLPLSVGGMGLVVFFISGALLAPLRHMAEHLRGVTPSTMRDGLPVGTGGEISHLAEVLNETLLQLDEAFERQKSFTAEVTHELRTPLTALRACGERTLRSRPGEEEAYECIAEMLETSERMSALVEAMLLMARADSGDAALRREKVDAGAVAREAVELLEVLAQEKDIDLTLRGTKLEVMADRTFLRQAVINLLHNALKFTPEAGRVEVECLQGGGWASIGVSDTGPGISITEQRRIFERFYQTAAGRAETSSGAGLGLTLSQRIIQSLGGDILVESTPGKGSTFTIRLPLPHHEEA